MRFFLVVFFFDDAGSLPDKAGSSGIAIEALPAPDVAGIELEPRSKLIMVDMSDRVRFSKRLRTTVERLANVKHCGVWEYSDEM